MEAFAEHDFCFVEAQSNDSHNGDRRRFCTPSSKREHKKEDKVKSEKSEKTEKKDDKDKVPPEKKSLREKAEKAKNAKSQGGVK